MRFSGIIIIVNLTVRFGLEIYPTVRSGVVFKIGNPTVGFGAVFRYYRESYGAVQFCDKSYTMRFGAVSKIGSPTVRFGAVLSRELEILRCGSV